MRKPCTDPPHTCKKHLRTGARLTSAFTALFQQQTSSPHAIFLTACHQIQRIAATLLTMCHQILEYTSLFLKLKASFYGAVSTATSSPHAIFLTTCHKIQNIAATLLTICHQILEITSLFLQLKANLSRAFVDRCSDSEPTRPSWRAASFTIENAFMFHHIQEHLWFSVWASKSQTSPPRHDCSERK